MGNTPSCHWEPEKEEKTIFISQEKIVYRIPALILVEDGDNKVLLAFAEKRRTEDDSSSVALVMKTGTVEETEKTDQVNIKWSKLEVVKEAHLDGYRPMNPCPVYEKDSKTLFLFFICVKGTVSEGRQRFWGCNKARLCYIKTQDAGKNWSKVTDLTAEIGCWATFAVGPGHGIQTKSKTLIVPMYAYTSCTSCCCCIICNCSIPYALSLYSEDRGQSWKLGKMLQTPSIECEMAEIFDEGGQSAIYCNARSKGGYRVEALDKNDKASFITLSSAKKLVETDDGCQGSVVSFPAGDVDSSQNSNHWLLFTHPSKESRSDLGVYLNQSPVNPETWSEPWIINKGPSGYSDLAYIGKGWFACLLECGKDKYTEQIACMVFHYREVLEGIKK